MNLIWNHIWTLPRVIIQQQLYHMLEAQHHSTESEMAQMLWDDIIEDSFLLLLVPRQYSALLLDTSTTFSLLGSKECHQHFNS